MKMNMKKLTEKADNEVFDDLIKKCEAKMSSPFKKDEPEATEVEMEPKEEMEEGSEEQRHSHSDLSPEDLQKLLEMYESLKGG